MKKVISVLVIMAVFSTTVFAAPLSVAGSWDKQSQKVSPRSELSATADALNEFDDLFGDVQAVALTTEEAQTVEGEGFLSGLAGFISGVIQYGVQSSVNIVRCQSNGTPQEQVSNMFTGAIINGIAGGIAGAVSPLP